jgi:hypothetical protein
LHYAAFAAKGRRHQVGESTVLQNILGRILGSALLLYGGSAFPFTLITLPEQNAPSESITTATTLETQVQPIASTIRAQLFSVQRAKRAQRVSQARPVLVASSGRRGGFEYLAANEASGAGPSGGGTESLWISAAANSLENDFSRTAFYGATHNLLAGFDVTRADRYVLGFAFGHEASNFTTTFNAGNEKTRGFSVNPYFAYLLSDAWSVDLLLGYGELDTRQSRTVGSILVPFGTDALNSEFASTRGFASTNLTYLTALGNWKLSGALGYTATRREQDGYVETGTLGTTVSASKQTVKQVSVLGEAAYGRGASETYFGLLYEDTRDPQKVQFATGPQPANDPDSVLLSAGWRYFGKGLTANFAFSKRVAQDQVNEYGFSMMLRVDL